MKHTLFLFLAIIYFGFSANAQNAMGRCNVPYTSEDLSVAYYNDRLSGGQNGHLEISNNSELTISQAHILVKVLIRWEEKTKGSTFPIMNKKTLILCDDDFYNIPPKKTIEKTSSKRGIIKGGPEKSGKTYQYIVEISDVVPEPVPFPEPQKR